jgi:hypothetical protein
MVVGSQEGKCGLRDVIYTFGKGWESLFSNDIFGIAAGFAIIGAKNTLSLQR